MLLNRAINSNHLCSTAIFVTLGFSFKVKKINITLFCILHLTCRLTRVKHGSFDNQLTSATPQNSPYQLV